MLETSSTGRAAPKIKTINVEANLLAQRIAEQERVREMSFRRLVGFCLSALLGVGTLPYLYGLDTSASHALEAVETRVADLDALLRDAEQRRELVQPVLDEIALHEKSSRNLEVLIGESTLFASSASPQVAFGVLKVEVSGSELRLSVVAESESYAAAREFVAMAAKGERVTASNLVTMRRSDRLGSQGVRFEFTKKVALQQ